MDCHQQLFDRGYCQRRLKLPASLDKILQVLEVNIFEKKLIYQIVGYDCAVRPGSLKIGP